MRRTILVVVVVLAVVALPLLGIGQPFTNHGGPPQDVFMTQTDHVCNDDRVGTEPVSLLPTPVSVGELSHVLVYFTATISTGGETGVAGIPGSDNEFPEVVLGLRIEGVENASSGQWIEGGGRGHSTVTVMWPFNHMPPGDYIVHANANMGGRLNGTNGANLQSCTLTAFVMPVEA